MRYIKETTLISFLRRYPLLWRMAYRHTAAWKALFPDGEYYDKELVQENSRSEERKLIRQALQSAKYDLPESEIGLVLSHIIQDKDTIDYNLAHHICMTLSRIYRDEIAFMERYDFVERELIELRKEVEKSNPTLPTQESSGDAAESFIITSPPIQFYDYSNNSITIV